MYDRLTDRARVAMQKANQEAQRFNHEFISVEHVLLALMKDPSPIIALILQSKGLEPRVVQLQVEKKITSGPDMVTMGKLPQTPRCRKAVEYAMAERTALCVNQTSTAHLFVGLLLEAQGIAYEVLQGFGFQAEEVRELIRQHPEEDRDPPKPKPAKVPDMPPSLGNAYRLTVEDGDIPSLVEALLELGKKVNIRSIIVLARDK